MKISKFGYFIGLAFTTIIFKGITVFGQNRYVDGYTVVADKDCSVNDIASYDDKAPEECKGYCDALSNCVGFVIVTVLGYDQCYVKAALCSTPVDAAGRHIYFRLYLSGITEFPSAKKFVNEMDHRGKQLTNHVIIGLRDVDLHQCSGFCARYDTCQSFNYDAVNQICEINNSTSQEYPDNVENNVNFKFWQKD